MVTQGRNNRPTPLPHRLHPTANPSFIILWPTSHHAPEVPPAGNPMPLNASEASTQNDTQRHQPPFTAKRTTVTTDRKADAEAGHRRCSSQDRIPSEISQCGASAIAAHCISHRSALHQHLQRTAPGTPAICHTHRTRYPETAQQACRPQPPSFHTITDSPLRSTYPTSSPSLSHCPIVPTTLILPHKTLPHHHPPASDSQPGIVALHTHHSSPLYPQRQPAFSIPHHGPPQPTKNPPITP